MAATCNFCNRTFSSSQGVRAHLKTCLIYRNNKNPLEVHKQEITPKLPQGGCLEAATRSVERHVEHENDSTLLDAGKHQFWQKEQLGQKSGDEERRRFQEDYEREKLRKEAIAERQRQDKKSEAEQENQKRKQRETIQAVKQSVIDWHFRWNDVPNEVKAATKLEIERVLGSLPVLELPRYELIELAEGIRERHYKAYFKAVEAEKPKRKEVVPMPKTRIYSGIFYCPHCDADFKVEQEEESELVCDDCGTKLEQDDGDSDD